MNIVQVLFYVMALVTLGSALVVAVSKNLVRSIFMFFVTLFGLAGLYVLAVADFVAVTQIVIYVGGILVLILFAFMLSGKEALEAVNQQKNRFMSMGNLPGFILAALFLVVMVNVILKADVAALPWIKAAKEAGNVIPVNESGINNIGINLMTKYLLPFEAISVLLMIALVGAAHLSRKEANE
jgi:NADH:ubiquinone oxidoreductase subunit 6 (subunit J)